MKWYVAVIPLIRAKSSFTLNEIPGLSKSKKD
jgi:hypothetical protein